MRPPLTVREGQVLAAIRALTTPDGVAPSLKEIAEHVGLKSSSDVHRLAGVLLHKGHVRWTPKRARSLQLVASEPTKALVETVSALCVASVRDGAAPDFAAIQAALRSIIGARQ